MKHRVHPRWRLGHRKFSHVFPLRTQKNTPSRQIPAYCTKNNSHHFNDQPLSLWVAGKLTATLHATSKRGRPLQRVTQCLHLGGKKKKKKRKTQGKKRKELSSIGLLLFDRKGWYLIGRMRGRKTKLSPIITRFW